MLIQFPEIINLLNDHLGLTVRVGDRYRRNPDGVIHRADSLNLAETRQNAADAEAWKQSIEQNPDEAEDLKNAANDYATENGYTRGGCEQPHRTRTISTIIPVIHILIGMVILLGIHTVIGIHILTGSTADFTTIDVEIS